MMTRVCIFSCCATVLLGFSSAVAQAPTTVQLPSISTFSYSGTVVVPDGGTVSLGGVNRSATGLNRRGLSRGFGSDQSRSNASITAHIIDLDEMDRQILGGTPEEFLRRSRQQEAAAGKHAVKFDPDAEGKALVRLARNEYRSGKQSRAFASYQMAIQVLSPSLRQLATREFKRVFGSSAEQALRTTAARRF